MENINFVPRDDVCERKSDPKEERIKSSSEFIRQGQHPEKAPSLDKNSNVEEPINEVNKGPRESIETVFEKLRTDEDKTDSTTDSAFISVTEKVFEKHSLDTPPLHFEIRGSLPDPITKKELTDSLDTLKSPSNTYSRSCSPKSKLSRRHTNVSNVFPIGCMGCKEESSQNIPTLPITQDNVQSSNENNIAEEEHLEQENSKRLQETRRRMIRRKDGNPLLGVGYEDSRPTFMTTCKIPPGGFSHGIW